MSLITSGPERYLGFFTSQYVFRITVVFITSERLVFRRSRIWIVGWIVGAIIGLVGPILTTFTSLDIGVGFIIQIIMTFVIGRAFGESVKRRYRTVSHITLQKDDLDLPKESVLQIGLESPDKIHTGHVTILSMSHEPIDLRINSKRTFDLASRILTKLYPKAVRTESKNS